VSWRSRLAVVVLAGAGIAELLLARREATVFFIGQHWHLEALIGIWAAVGLIAAAAAHHAPRRVGLAGIVVLAVGLRLVAASGAPPSISSDVYRYMWDAHVQLSGIDPYSAAPNSPSLQHLHPVALWPTPDGCARDHRGPGCSRLNRPQDRTIYPAVAEIWFVAVHLVNPDDYGTRPWQLAAGFVDDLTVVLLAFALARQGRDPRAVAWYALCPLPVVEFANNGHVDGVALLLMVAAVLALRRDRRVLAGVLIGLATMVKLYPALGVVAGWRQGRWRLAVAAVATMVLTEAPHVVAVGVRVLGYLPGYLREERYTSGGRFLLLGLAHLPGRVAVALAVALIAATAVEVVRRRVEAATALTVLLGAVVFVATPVQPWYAVAVGGVAVLADFPLLLAAAAAAEPYYAAVELNSRHQIAIGRLSYGLAGLVVGAALLRRRRRGILARGEPVRQAVG